MLRRVMWLAVYAIAVLAAVKSVVDTDLWWHLRTGEWISETGGVPVTDPFSTAGPDKPWVAYSWLYDVLLFGLHRELGLTGILIFRVAMVLAIVFTFQRLAVRRGTEYIVALALTGVAAVALIRVMTERSWLFSILFSAFTLQAILTLREEGRGRLVWLLPVVFAVWANVHIQFVYGLFVLGLACAAPLMDRSLRWPTAPDTAATAGTLAWRNLVVLTAACFLATLINHYGYRVYEAVWEAVTQPGPASYIDEMKAMEFRYASEWATLLLAGAAAFALGRRRDLSAFDLLFLLAGSYCAFRAKRDVWFLILAALAIVPPAVRTSAAPEESGPRLPGFAWGVLGALAIAAYAVFIGWGRDLSESGLREEVRKAFPVEAVRVAKGYHAGGPVFNSFNWGGYLMWELKGDRVALDGRCNVHGDDRILTIGAAWDGHESWKTNVDLAAAAVVIGERGAALSTLLKGDNRFREVYEDAQAVVFVRKGS